MHETSEADRFFGQQAVDREFVTQDQIDECYTLLAKFAAEGNPKALADILVEQGYMTDAQIEEIQQRVRFMELRDQDRAFGKQCVKKGWITLKQMDSCLEIQRNVFRKSGEIRSLGEILVQQKMLTPETQEKVGALFGMPGYTSTMPQARPAGAADPAGDEPAVSAAKPEPAAPPAPAAKEPSGFGQQPTELKEIRPGTQKVPLATPARPSAGVSTQAIPRKACPFCKILIAANANKCVNCGALFCAQCGHVSAARSPSCLGCGHRFDGAAPMAVPSSMAMWLQPPYVYFLGMAIAAALALLVVIEGDPGPGRSHFEGAGHTAHRDPPANLPDTSGGGRKTDPIGTAGPPRNEAGTAKVTPEAAERPSVYEGAVFTVDGAIHRGRISERKDKVAVKSQYGEVTIPRSAIREIRREGPGGGVATGPGGAGTQPGTGTGPSGTATGGATGKPITSGETKGPNPSGPGGTTPAGTTRTTIPPPTLAFEPEPTDPCDELPALPGIDNQQRVRLKDGRELTGTATRKGDEVEIRLKMGSLTVPADQVEEITTSPDQVYADLARETPAGDAGAHLALAKKMREQECAKWARREYLLAVAAEPQQVAAHRALGHFEAGGRWRSAEGQLRHADACILVGEAAAAQKALEAVQSAVEDTASWDQPVATREQKYRAAESLIRCHLRAGRPADARAASQRLYDLSIPSQRPRAKVIQDILAAHGDKGTVELGSADLAVNLLDDSSGALGMAPGPHPLWDARVIDILVRREAAAIVGMVKDRIDEGSRARSADPDRALSLFENAEALCENANELVPGFARSYQLEAVRQQIPLLFNKAQFFIQKANECHPTKQKYAYDPKTKKMLPDSVKEFGAKQREWNTWIDRCKTAIDRAVRLAEKYPGEMQDRLDTLREYQRYLNEKVPGMRKESAAFRNASGKSRPRSGWRARPPRRARPVGRRHDVARPTDGGAPRRGLALLPGMGTGCRRAGPGGALGRPRGGGARPRRRRDPDRPRERRGAPHQGARPRSPARVAGRRAGMGPLRADHPQRHQPHRRGPARRLLPRHDLRGRRRDPPRARAGSGTGADRGRLHQREIRPLHREGPQSEARPPRLRARGGNAQLAVSDLPG